MSDTRLYLITPTKFELDIFATQLADALDGGDVASVQLRMKDSYDDDIIKAAKVLMPICHSKDVAFIINDRPDIALKVNADGVHIGQDDVSYKEARKIVGADNIVGVTAKNSRHLAMLAGEAGADYVAFGAFFPTSTKTDTTIANVDLLTWWQELFEIPCVAIGGITVDNAQIMADAGADFIAVCSGIWDYKDGPKEAVRKLNSVIR